MNDLNEKIILAGAKLKNPTPDAINVLKRRFLRAEKGIKRVPNAPELLKSYHKLVHSNKLKENQALEHALIKRAVRTLSGVTIITVLTKPFPCPGKCTYCPNDPQMPKSYISDEPAAARALSLRFDPYEQVVNRIQSLEANGHPTDKVELIVKGGTWNSYKLEYQYWFILRCFQGCNVGTKKSVAQALPENTDLKKIRKLLATAQKKNETAKHRIIGLTLETRPDWVTEESVIAMREMGCTRIELGVQNTDDKILEKIRRGHTGMDSKRATALLRHHGYKVDFHLMPQLPDATPESDLKMLLEIFSDPGYRPDMLKIYPCSVIENTELFEQFKRGEFKPYPDKDLISVLKKFKAEVPRYVRISRLIRDIPSHHVKAGNIVTNLRQVIQAEMIAEGTHCKCLRCREVGHQKNWQGKKMKMFVDKYKASDGDEYFISFEDLKRTTVFAFCRLRIDKQGVFPAFIRELHTYGQMLAIGEKNTGDSQHKGMGKKLVMEAENIAKKNGCDKLAIISGIGVRDYYRHLGFEVNNTYMVKNMI